MKRKSLTKQAFGAWLRRQRKGRVFVTQDANLCPIATYLGEGSSVDNDACVWGDGSMATPSWAQAFIEKVDMRHEVTVGDSLRILHGVGHAQAIE